METRATTEVTSFAERRADHLVDSVVPADIFTNEQPSAVRAEQRRGVQPAGFIEGFLFLSTTVTSTPTRPIRAGS